jgi:hypothetical protein
VKYDLDKDGFITLEETMQNLDLIQRKYKLLFGRWPLKSLFVCNRGDTVQYHSGL